MPDFGLWNASFRGVPFHVESDQEKGKRRVAVHEFPMRDDPFLEDLGEGPRTYEVTAYVAADLVQGGVEALLAALAAEGPGVLVLPLGGPRQARAIEFSRAFERDKLGYAAISASFVREGAATGLASIAELGNDILAAVDDVLGAAGDLLADGLALVGLPGHVAEAALGAFEDLIGGIEAIRGGEILEAVASGLASSALSTLFADLGDAVSRTSGFDVAAAAGLADAARTVSGAMGPAEAMAAFGGLADAPLAQISPRAMTPAATAIDRNGVLLARFGRVVALAAYSDAIVRREFATRQEGVAARAEAGERFNLALNEASSARDEPLVLALQDLAGKVADFLSREVSTLAPVVTVSAPASMPALWWAWRLYGDPGRALELVGRNAVKNPAFMPEAFEALAS